MPLTIDHMFLLVDLKASQERGSASRQCSGQVQEALELEKRGFVKRHKFGDAFFFITQKGLDAVTRGDES